jgi:hypothetical protein
MLLAILALVLRACGTISEDVFRVIVGSHIIFNLPAYGALQLITIFTASGPLLFMSAIVLNLSWSALLAWFFWRVAATLLGEEEAPDQHGRYDWAGFRVRFFFGFIIGFLIGWRVVKNTKSMHTLLIASVIGGIVGGIAYGLYRPPDFWARP